ncbi:MAG TPA: sigma-54 dependent transcriptional regulator [Candidatus Kapabacteria bacterium]
MLSVLIIDDEASLRDLLSRILRLEGYQVFEAATASQARETLAQERIPVVVTDVILPDANGVELVAELKAKYPETEFIVITAYGTIEGGVAAMRNGAFDYITKGDEDDRIILTVEKAAEKADLRRQVRELQQRIDSKVEFSKLIGKSEAISRSIELAKKVAPTDTTVLLLGETGTGKELFAEAIHRSSKRREKPFVAINCSAIPRDLQESELFGHKKGAFTGAVQDKIGLFEEAHTGTIFLDEIGDMTPETQTKLLRAIETKTITRLGDTKPRAVDMRFIAATNVNLREAIDEKRFREDLYYRLNGFTIFLPPLRERLDDIDLLAHHFVALYSAQFQKNISGMTEEFRTSLKRQRWTGNIRELKNIIERAVLLSSGEMLGVDLLPDEIRTPTKTTDVTAIHTLEEVERNHILRVLKQAENNKTQAAKLLGISTATLYRKLKEYGLE